MGFLWPRAGEKKICVPENMKKSFEEILKQHYAQYFAEDITVISYDELIEQQFVEHLFD